MYVMNSYGGKNKMAKGIYKRTQQHKDNISINHADVSGKNNPNIASGNIRNSKVDTDPTRNTI